MPELVLRRVINFHDLTMCLDKRNASGKIEHYQDPLLYRYLNLARQEKHFLVVILMLGRIPAMICDDVSVIFVLKILGFPFQMFPNM